MKKGKEDFLQWAHKVEVSPDSAEDVMLVKRIGDKPHRREIRPGELFSREEVEKYDLHVSFNLGPATQVFEE